jgi:EmrB/QacA subfamily drug resistance transporter
LTPKPRQHYNVTLLVLMTAALSYALLQTMVAPALPSIQHDLGASTTGVTWVLTIYLLTASIATPIAGRMGDMYGKHRVLVIVLGIFALGSLIAALSHSLPMLVAGRAVQGIGGATFPLAFGIIRDEFPPEKVPTAIGTISATFGIGGGAGLVLAGLLVDNLAWEWIFWLGFVVVAMATVAAHLFVPESPVKAPAKIDWAGATLLSLGLGALLLAFSKGNAWGWGSTKVSGLIVVSLIILAAWIRFERGVPQPLVDMKMMQRRGVWTTNLTGLLVGFGMFSSFIIIPQLVQTPTEAGVGFGATVTQAGLFLLPSTAVMLIAGPLSGKLGSRYGSRVPLLMGTGTAAVAFAFLAADHSERWHIYVGSALMGAGIGLAFAAMANLIVGAVEPNETGVASGMNTIMRTIGGALGAQIVASIVASHQLNGLPENEGFTLAFTISAVGMALALLAALLIPRPRRDQEQPVGSSSQVREPAAARA